MSYESGSYESGPLFVVDGHVKYIEWDDDSGLQYAGIGRELTVIRKSPPKEELIRRAEIRVKRAQKALEIAQMNLSHLRGDFYVPFEDHIDLFENGQKLEEQKDHFGSSIPFGIDATESVYTKYKEVDADVK